MQERKEDDNKRGEKKNITVMKVQKEIFDCANPKFEKMENCAKLTLNERI